MTSHGIFPISAIKAKNSTRSFFHNGAAHPSSTPTTSVYTLEISGSKATRTMKQAGTDHGNHDGAEADGQQNPKNAKTNVGSLEKL